MAKYRAGQTVYFISNNSFIIEAIVKRYGSGFYTLKYTEENGGVRLRENRLFGSKEEASNKLKINKSKSKLNTRQ